MLTGIIGLIGMVLLLVAAMHTLRSQMLDERIEKVRGLADVGRGIVASYRQRALNGEFDEAEAKARAVARLRDLRYQGNGYFFIYDETGTNILLPYLPDREGRNFIDLQDANGVFFIKELIDGGRNGGSPVFYRFPRTGTELAIDKVGVALSFEPWRWVIGTGVYIDDLDAEFATELLHLSLIPIIVVLASAGAIFLIARSVSRPLLKLTGVMERLSRRDFDVEVPFRGRGDEIGAIARAVAVFRENGMARQSAEEKLHASERHLMVITENAPSLIWMIDAKGIVTYANRGISGKERDEVIGGTVIEWVCEEHRERVERTLGEVFSTGQPGRCEFMGLNDERRWYSTRTAPVFDGRRITGAVIITNDVTDRKAAEAQVEFLAHHDALTDLPNRILGKLLFDQIIIQAERAGSRAAMLFFDLDNFKRVNDSLGHAGGDLLLKAVADRLIDCVRDSDLVVRQSGDEFIILMPNVGDVDDVSSVANKILEQLRPPFDIGGELVSISASLGAVVFPEDGGSFDELFKKADTAARFAKDAGRNTYRFFTEQMNANADEYLRIRTGLRQALERGEFLLHYQPQIVVDSGRVIGAEALIRWNHPELGLLAPGRFISIAEDSGLIVPIGEWVLGEACRQCAAWQAEGLPRITIAVNLSAVQFKRGDLLEVVTRALRQSKLDPSCLELEMTESALVKDSSTVMKTVERLKSLGVIFSIDDFGTGYSSLAYLKQFKVDKLKIDQSFVREITQSASDAAIVTAIVALARSLGLKTVAEGIESKEVLDCLRSCGCDEAQGYHLGRPMPAGAFAEILRRVTNPQPVQ
ncbi:EAL domain-containing protein [Telmatospirillum siberiense]|nr:EAL domain-containing protein [Telmatospirillum siberiense]